MSEVYLGNNIFIEDFYDSLYLIEERPRIGSDNILYSGKVVDISDDLANKLVEKAYFGEYYQGMWQYEGYINFDIDSPYCYVDTAKKSIVSACKKEFCIIFKRELNLFKDLENTSFFKPNN
jgi:hypothetical protein